MLTNWLAKPVHSRGDGLSSPSCAGRFIACAAMRPIWPTACPRPAAQADSSPAQLYHHPGRWLAGYALAFTLNLAEETVRFTTDTSREEEFIGLARGIAIAEG